MDESVHPILDVVALMGHVKHYERLDMSSSIHVWVEICLCGWREYQEERGYQEFHEHAREVYLEAKARLPEFVAELNRGLS